MTEIVVKIGTWFLDAYSKCISITKNTVTICYPITKRLAS